MAAPSTASIAKFIAAPPNAIAGFLFYGSDSAQISAKAETLVLALVRKDPNTEILRLHEDDIAADPERILVELTTRTLFGNRKTVWLTHLPAKAHPALLDAVARPIEDCWLVVQAPELRKSHKITQIFEAASFLAAIACYSDDRASLSSSIAQRLSAAGFQIEPEALALIMARCNFSPATARSETEKLMTFVGDARKITIDDVDACLGDQQMASIQEIVDAALEGDGRAALSALERFAAGEQNLAPLHSALATALQRLHFVKASANGGIPIAEAIRAAKPPIFFKQQDAVTRQARIWSADALLDLLGRVNTVIREARLKPQLAEAITRNFLLEIAKSGRQLQKRR